MRYQIIAELLAENKIIDTIGQHRTDGYKSSEIYCVKGAVRQSEFYDAAQQGLKPSFVLETSIHDYSGEKLVRVDGIIYQIYRTYEPVGSETVELYCTEKVGV